MSNSMSDAWDELEINLAELHELSNQLLRAYDAIFSGNWENFGGGLDFALKEYTRLSALLYVNSRLASHNLEVLENVTGN